MAEAKKKAAPKVIDIHKPGKTAATPTAKPVIVTNRQILRDPMVTEEATTPVEESKVAPPSTTAKVVAPPSAPPVPKDAEKAADEPAAEPKLEAPIPPLTDETMAPEAKNTAEAESSPDAAASQETAPEETTGEEATKEASQDAEPAVTDTTEPETSEESAAEAPRETEDSPTEPAPEEDEPATEPAADPAEETKEATPDNSGDKPKKDGEPAVTDEDAAAAEHDATIQKMVDSKQFFLPINTVEKRRVERFIALGIFVTLLLAVAWIDVALDAGIIHIDNIKPVTHFFSN